MPVPAIIAGAAAVAGRLAAKKVAQEAAKKAAAKAAKKVSTSGYGMSKKGLTVSNDVRVKSSTSSSKLKANPGAKQVIDQNIKTASKTTKSEARANARGLKAAQKPTNKTGTKADRAQRAELQGNSNLIKNAEPARANRTRGGSLYAQKVYGGQGLVSKTLTPKQAARRAEITKELNPTRKAKDLASKKKAK